VEKGIGRGGFGAGGFTVSTGVGIWGVDFEVWGVDLWVWMSVGAGLGGVGCAQQPGSGFAVLGA